MTSARDNMYIQIIAAYLWNSLLSVSRQVSKINSTQYTKHQDYRAVSEYKIQSENSKIMKLEVINTESENTT